MERGRITPHDCAWVSRTALEPGPCQQLPKLPFPLFIGHRHLAMLIFTRHSIANQAGFVSAYPQAQGKIERWHQTMKNRIPLANYYLPGALQAEIEDFVEQYKHQRYHESLNNLTSADVYFGRGQTILLERKCIKRRTSQHRRLMPQQNAA